MHGHSLSAWRLSSAAELHSLFTRLPIRLSAVHSDAARCRARFTKFEQCSFASWFAGEWTSLVRRGRSSKSHERAASQ